MRSVSPERPSADLTAWPPGLFRFIHLLGGGAWIVFGFAIAALLPDRWDPVWIRALMAGLYFALVAMSWSGRFEWCTLRKAALVVYFVTTLHSFVMLAMNDAALPYALVLVVNNVGIATGLDRPGEQIAWGLFSVLGAAVAWSVIPEPQTSGLFIGAALMCFHGIFSAVYRRVWLALAAATREQAHFTATFDSSGDALLLLSPDGCIERANGQAVALFAGPKVDLVARSFDRLRTEVDPDRVPAGRPVRLEMRRADGAPFTAEVVWQDLPGDAGAVVRVSDVTQAEHDRAKMQEGLRQAEALANAKGTFIATMSHEIRTPMTGVLGMLELLSDEPLTESQELRVSAATRAAQSLRSILDQILEYSKLESGHLDVDPRPSSPRAVLQEIVDLFAPRLQHDGLEMPVHVAEDVPGWVMIDPVRIRQVLMNLVGNAVKFTEEGEVRVRLEREAEGALCWTVEDTGAGMDEQTLGRVFEPFVQADASNARPHGGTGLGLAISRQLAELMGGSLEAGSAVGEGSRFTLRVPAPEVAAPAPRPETSADLAVIRPGTRVLVAEDNAVNRMVVKGMLRRLGLDATLVEDGAAAVARVREDPAWDLILMDVQMPNLDGLEATRLIRRAFAERHRIVALTASVAHAERESCLAAGMDGVLAKPVDLRELRRVLSDLPTPARAASS